eukprot:scaffold92853_cov45-Attheya_sp.AAC.1
MSELQTFIVDSEALSLLASVTSRESATDPEELKVRRRGGACSVCARAPRPCASSTHGRFLHMGAFFIRITEPLRVRRAAPPFREGQKARR